MHSINIFCKIYLGVRKNRLSKKHTYLIVNLIYLVFKVCWVKLLKTSGTKLISCPWKAVLLFKFKYYLREKLQTNGRTTDWPKFFRRYIVVIRYYRLMVVKIKLEPFIIHVSIKVESSPKISKYQIWYYCQIKKFYILLLNYYENLVDL